MRRLVLKDILMKYEKSSKIRDSFELKIDNMTIEQGEFFTLIGESGCGKTTALRIIAGLENAINGSVVLDSRNITRVQPESRGIGMVFQKPLLFPHMSVYENLAFALKVQKTSSSEIKNKIREILGEIDLSGYESKYPSELSGGESQRVSLARSLLLDPEVLLMDEPFSALDVNTRLEMQKLIKKLHISRNMTIIFVTHDLEEAFSLSDKVAIVDKGSILQIDTPYEIYNNPSNEFVAKFVGITNVYSVEEIEILLGKDKYYEFSKKYIGKENTGAKFAFRPKSIYLDANGSISDSRLVYSRFKGDKSSLHFEKENLNIIVDSRDDYESKLAMGQRLNLELDYSQMRIIKE